MVEKQDMVGSSIQTGNIKIGEIIQSELRRQKRTVTWFSNMLNCDRRNIYDIFLRNSIDTQLLYKISMVLGVDFFSMYSHALNDKLCHEKQ